MHKIHIHKYIIITLTKFGSFEVPFSQLAATCIFDWKYKSKSKIEEKYQKYFIKWLKK